MLLQIIQMILKFANFAHRVLILQEGISRALIVLLGGFLPFLELHQQQHATLVLLVCIVSLALLLAVLGSTLV